MKTVKISQETHMVQTPHENEPIRKNLLNQKGNFLLILGVVVLVLVVLGVGAYYLGIQKNKSSHQPQNNQIQTSPTSKVSNGTTQKLTGSFQEIMDRYCKETKMMRVEDLPVKLSPTVAAKIVPNKENPVGCPHGLEPLTWNAMISNDINYTTLAITDNPKSTAIIGVPTYRKIIKDSQDGQISLWYQDNPYDPNKDTIYALGEKSLLLSNGETVYVRFGIYLIDKTNPRFTSIKNKTYGSEVSNNNTVDNQLYTELTKQSPEKDNLVLIEKVLQGVTAK